MGLLVVLGPLGASVLLMLLQRVEQWMAIDDGSAERPVPD
jgi:hypothetical protein